MFLRTEAESANVLRQRHRKELRRDEIKNDVAYSQPRFRTWLKHITAMYNRLRYKIINIVYLRVYVLICLCGCVYVYMYVCVCICVYVETEGGRDRRENVM